IIQDYIARDYPKPKDFASFLYVSQVLQAEGIKIGAEHFRRSRPQTMGSIFWQLNDCWPVASWSSIDYFGRWKALQYYARRFYAPILVSPHVEDGALKVYIVSDKTQAEQGTLRLRLMDFQGNVLLDKTQSVEIAPQSSNVAIAWPLDKLTDVGVADAARVIAVANLIVDGLEISRNLTYLVPVKNVQLPQAPLTAQFSGENGSFKIRITSPVLARDIYLSFGDLDAKVSDNYFDLLPGETVMIIVTSPASIENLRAQMKVISLTDAFGSEKEPTSGDR
ncbi:MAG: glycoside hydrolase family 2 protein, partial [Terracidiphilus sp.]